MHSEEAFNNIKIVMNDCYEAGDLLAEGDQIYWDAQSYYAMAELLEDVLKKYFLWDGK